MIFLQQTGGGGVRREALEYRILSPRIPRDEGGGD